MNIFYLHEDPKTCAEMHVDKHVVKMILEYSQLLSTAHRLLDGKPYLGKTANGRNIKRWLLEEPRESLLYKASHINHPSAVWTRKNQQNYIWLTELLVELCKEYTHRYGKVHSSERSGLVQFLYDNEPKNLPIGPFTEPTPAMPDEYKVSNDSLTSYHNYYNGAKQRMFSWKNRSVPTFINTNV